MGVPLFKTLGNLTQPFEQEAKYNRQIVIGHFVSSYYYLKDSAFAINTDYYVTLDNLISPTEELSGADQFVALVRTNFNQLRVAWQIYSPEAADFEDIDSLAVVSFSGGRWNSFQQTALLLPNVWDSIRFHFRTSGVVPGSPYVEIRFASRLVPIHEL